MPNILTLEEVFKTNGVPTHTFVEPRKYADLLISLRTPGRCLVVEGPSGIGKSTAIERALEATGTAGSLTKLSARRQADIEYIQVLPDMKDTGIVLVDDFHKLDNASKQRIADLLKIIADSENPNSKIIVLGINRAGEGLIHFASDLVNRIDIIRFEAEPDERIHELLRKGQDALNISLGIEDDIVAASRGSFYLAQMLAKETCLSAKLLSRPDNLEEIQISFESVKASVWERLGAAFKRRCEDFAKGTRLRKEGRAPYLHILNWLATSNSWTLDLREAIRHHEDLRGSVTQVVEKEFLKNLIDSNSEIRNVMHFDDASQLLSIEDPQFLYYIRNIPWRQFARGIGFVTIDFERRYDFALSFAGADRDIAAMLFRLLAENETEVFYDKNEQHRILAEDVEEYLRPIYQSEAEFVVAILGKEYPKRIWTRIESEAFKDRFDNGSVVPVWFSDSDVSTFDKTRELGGYTIDRTKDIPTQINEITELLLAKLRESHA